MSRLHKLVPLLGSLLLSKGGRRVAGGGRMDEWAGS